ncbi:MAG TPA: retropepsin-like aspartic protease [Allosphingosinicella sp.]|jgi:clan AA aspartic protease (TIGR02281 family)
MASRLLPLLALLALAGCDRLARQATKEVEYRPEQAKTVDHALCLLGFEGVPLRAVATGHHLVTAQVNGHSGAFVIDTGANASVLNAGDAAAFGVGQGITLPGAAAGLGGPMQARQARIESMAIGGIAIRQSRIMVADLAQLRHILGQASGEQIAGIISQDVMQEHRAVIDAARPILYLIAADRDPAPVPAERCRKPATAAKNR